MLTCPRTGKLCHTYGAALAHRASLRRRDQAEMSVYFCFTCRSYHIGRRRERVERMRREQREAHG
jgi:hypothetical protein